MRQSYQILILCYIIIIGLLLYSFSANQNNNRVSHQAWDKYESSFTKLMHISTMLNQMQHLTRIYLTTTTTNDPFELDELVLTASKARSIYIEHYLELEKLSLDDTEKDHLALINNQAGKIRLAQLEYDKILLKGITLEKRLRLAIDTIINPQNTTQQLMQNFLNYIRIKTISDSIQYKEQEKYQAKQLKNLQIITMNLTLLLSIFSVYSVFKGQKTINDKNHALSQAESFLHSTIDSTPVALIITDQYGQIIMANNKAESVFEYSREQLVLMNVSELIPESVRSSHAQHIKQYVNKPVSREMYTGMTLNAVRHSGEIFPVEVGLSPVDGQDSLYIACSIKDITEQKRMEHEILESKNQAEQASHAKSEFLANVSHELRTPLHAILSFSRLGLKNAQRLPEELRAGNKMQNYFNKIQLSGDKLLNFINDLLDSAKFESGKMKLHLGPYDLQQAVKQVMNEQEARLHELKIHLSVTAPEPGCAIECDKDRINQVMNNLIANAIKFSPENGQIELAISPDTLTDQNNHSQKAVRVTISDEGPGIPENNLERIFERFFQSSNSAPGGTGLGLSLCKDIITAHGGKIWAENGQKQGSIFTYILPLKQS